MNEDYVGSRLSSKPREEESFRTGLSEHQLRDSMDRVVSDDGEIMRLAKSLPKDLARLRELVGVLGTELRSVSSEPDVAIAAGENSEPHEPPQTELGHLLLSVKGDIWNLQEVVSDTIDRIKL